MADYKKEIEEVLRSVYAKHDIVNQEFPNYESFVGAMFMETGESYESISEAIQEGIDKRGETLEENLEFMREQLLNDL